MLASGAGAVRFDEARMWVELDDGRTLGVPLELWWHTHHYPK